MLVVIVKD